MTKIINVEIEDLTNFTIDKYINTFKSETITELGKQNIKAISYILFEKDGNDTLNKKEISNLKNIVYLYLLAMEEGMKEIKTIVKNKLMK